jgi:hypothetical protein
MQLGKMLAAVYGLISLIIVPFILAFSVIGAFAGASGRSGGFGLAALGAGFGLVMILLLPLLYAAIGFIGGVLGGFIYNLVAKWVGGIEVEFES